MRVCVALAVSVGVAAAVSIGGCSSPGGPNAASVLAAGSPTAAGAGATAGPSCAPPAAPGGTPWPTQVPREIPTVPGAVLGPVSQSQGITYVKFSTAQSLRDGVLFLLDALPSAGFTLGRGDSERTEADAPFASPALFGSIRLTLVDDCRTDWLLATRPRGSSAGDAPVTPLIAPHTPSPGASPLPFG